MADQAIEEIIMPKLISLNPNISLWENLKEYLPSCSIARIIYCLLKRGWKYSDIGHIFSVHKHTIDGYLRRWRKLCVDPSLKIGKCIDCERYIKMLKLFGVDVKQIEKESWYWGEE